MVVVLHHGHLNEPMHRCLSDGSSPSRSTATASVRSRDGPHALFERQISTKKLADTNCDTSRELELVDTQWKLAQAVSRSKTLEAQAAGLRTSNATLSRRLHEMSTKYSEHATQRLDAEQQLKEALATIDTLEKSNAELEAEKNTIFKKVSRLIAAEIDLAAKTTKLASMEERLAQERADHDATKAALQRATAALASSMTDHYTARDRVTELTKELNTVKTERNALVLERKMTANILDDTNARLRSVRDMLSQERAAAKAPRASLRDTIFWNACDDTTASDALLVTTRESDNVLFEEEGSADVSVSLPVAPTITGDDEDEPLSQHGDQDLPLRMSFPLHMAPSRLFRVAISVCSTVLSSTKAPRHDDLGKLGDVEQTGTDVLRKPLGEVRNTA